MGSFFYKHKKSAHKCTSKYDIVYVSEKTNKNTLFINALL